MSFLDPKQIAAKAQEWGQLLDLKVDGSLEFSAPALLVLDMQNEFLLPSGQLPVWGGPAIIPNVARILQIFRQRQLPLVFTRHVCLEPFRHREQIAVMASIPDAATFLREGSMGVNTHPQVSPLQGEPIITKYRYSAFYDTPLDTLLKVNRIREVIITGVATNICCETTAHDAFFRGYDVFFALDGTGGTDETAHLASLRNIVRSYGKVGTIEQLVRNLPPSQSP